MGSPIRALRDENRVPLLAALSNDGLGTVVTLEADPATGRLLVNATGGGGGGGDVQYQELATTTPATGTLALGRYQTSLPTLTNGQMNEPMLDSSSRLLIGALPTGSNVIGHVITDTGSTTAVTGTVAVSGTVTANAGTNLNTSLLALESGGNLATLAGTVTASVLQTNTKQINGIVPLMGNGVTGTGSQRVTIASDNTAFSVKIDQTTVGTTNAVSIAQLGANTISTGNGVSGTGVQRVSIASDSTGQVALAAGTNTVGAVFQKAATATLTNVAASATSVTVLASNTSRVGAQIYNDSTVLLYLKFGTTASTTSFTVLLVASAYYEVPAGYNGKIDGIWASATGTARVTEITP